MSITKQLRLLQHGFLISLFHFCDFIKCARSTLVFIVDCALVMLCTSTLQWIALYGGLLQWIALYAMHYALQIPRVYFVESVFFMFLANFSALAEAIASRSLKFLPTLRVYVLGIRDQKLGIRFEIIHFEKPQRFIFLTILKLSKPYRASVIVFRILD